MTTAVSSHVLLKGNLARIDRSEVMRKRFLLFSILFSSPLPFSLFLYSLGYSDWAVFVFRNSLPLIIPALMCLGFSIASRVDFIFQRKQAYRNLLKTLAEGSPVHKRVAYVMEKNGYPLANPEDIKKVLHWVEGNSSPKIEKFIRHQIAKNMPPPFSVGIIKFLRERERENQYILDIVHLALSWNEYRRVGEISIYDRLAFGIAVEALVDWVRRGYGVDDDVLSAIQSVQSMMKGFPAIQDILAQKYSEFTGAKPKIIGDIKNRISLALKD